MAIIVCGMNHKTAPVALREQVVFSAEKMPLYLQDLLTHENMREVVLLSTCNRSELYCDQDDLPKIIDWFSKHHRLSRAELEGAMYFYRDQDAVRHIMEVACGLDSMVLGESQIVAQMKAAFSESCAAGAVGIVFNRLFQQVFAVAKEVRTNTAIGACPVSVSSAAVHFVAGLSPLEASTVVLIGAGMTIELVLRHLQSHRPKQTLMLNRTFESAFALAEKYGAKALHFSSLSSAIEEADIVISATGSTIPFVTPNMVQGEKGVRSHPLFIVDIAVPRDVEAAVAELSNVTLYSIDDLKTIIQQNKRGREHAAEKAREVIEERSQDFMAWLTSYDLVASTIRAYRKQIEDVSETELAKSFRQLQRGDDPKQVLANFAYALTQKLLHTPSVQLRQAGFEGRLDMLQLAQELFALSEPRLTELVN